MLKRLLGKDNQGKDVPLQTYSIEKKSVSTTLTAAPKVAASSATLQFIPASTLFMSEVPATPAERMQALDKTRKALQKQLTDLIGRHFINTPLLRRWHNHLQKISEKEKLPYECGFLRHKENLDALKPFDDIQKVMVEYLSIIENPQYIAYLDDKYAPQPLRRY